MRTHHLTRRTLLSLCLPPILAVSGRAQEMSPAKKLQTARDRLIRGIGYERAAELCREALKQTPDDWQISATLGCALTARAASLAYAALADATLRQAVKEYPKEVELYEKRLKDDSPDRPVDRPPVLPPPDPTAIVILQKDDFLPYRLTQTQFLDRMRSLTEEARTALEGARTAAKSDADKAEAAFIHGWGLRLLLRHGQEADRLTPPKFDDTPQGKADMKAWRESRAAFQKVLPRPDTVRQAFKDAIQLAPDNAVYWQALGDAWTDAENFAEATAEATVAYGKALELKPKNGPLWYRMFRWTMPVGKSAKALPFLRNASKYDPGNAWYTYEEAGFLISANPSEVRKALTTASAPPNVPTALRLIEEGNRASRAVLPKYRKPVPRLLAVAWGYDFGRGDFRIQDKVRLQWMAMAVAAYITYQAETERNLPEAERTCNLLIACGEKVMDGIPKTSNLWNNQEDRENLSVGDTLALMGYRNLVEILKDLAPDRAPAAEEQYAAYIARRAARRGMLETLDQYPGSAYLFYY